MLCGGRSQLSREPPLPGGWKPSDKVHFVGRSETLRNGDKLVHGLQGEVVGPATLESHKGKGVKVRFPGNKGGIDCHLTEVRRLHAPPPARPPASNAATPSSARPPPLHRPGGALVDVVGARR